MIALAPLGRALHRQIEAESTATATVLWAEWIAADPASTDAALDAVEDEILCDSAGAIAAAGIVDGLLVDAEVIADDVRPSSRDWSSWDVTIDAGGVVGIVTMIDDAHDYGRPMPLCIGLGGRRDDWVAPGPLDELLRRRPALARSVERAACKRIVADGAPPSDCFIHPPEVARLEEERAIARRAAQRESERAARRNDVAERREACQVLGPHYASDPTARAAILRLAADRDWLVRHAACAALAPHYLTDAEARTAIIRLADDDDWYVRCAAYAAISR